MKTIDELQGMIATANNIFEKNTLEEIIQNLEKNNLVSTDNVFIVKLIEEHQKIYEKYKDEYTKNKHLTIIEYLKTFLD